MQTEVAIIVVSLGIGLAVTVVFQHRIAAGVVGPAVGLTVGLLLSVSLFMAYYAMNNIRELVKQLAVWLAIVILLPLVVWYGTSAFSPPPDWKQYRNSTIRLSEQIQEAKSQAEKDRLRIAKDRLDEELDDAERVYYEHMFYVAYPIGLVAFIVGTFFWVQAVDSGLMFGGLISLATGCCSYWDRMGDWLRFISLVIALAVVLTLGTWRYRRTNPESSPASRC